MKVGVVTHEGLSFEKMYSEWNGFYNQGIAKNPKYLLKEILKKKGYELIDANLVDKDIRYILHYKLFDFNILNKFPNAKHIYMAVETISVENLYQKKSLESLIRNVYDVILTRNDCDEILNSVTSAVLYNFDINFKPTYKFNEKKLAYFIGSDNYSISKGCLYNERRKIIKFFEKNHPNDFDFYGMNGLEYYKRYSTYKGESNCKLHVGEKYKFEFTITGEKYSKYILDEKIFDSMHSGTIPIFSPIKNMDKYVPDNCYINYNRFSNLKELYLFLKNMDEQTYNEYLLNIQNYLNSEMIKPFKPESVAEDIIKAFTISKNTVKKSNTYIIRYLIFKRNVFLKLNGVKRRIGRWYYSL